MSAPYVGDDLCDICYTSGVTVARTLHDGRTVGIECGCDEELAEEEEIETNG